MNYSQKIGAFCLALSRRFSPSRSFTVFILLLISWVFWGAGCSSLKKSGPGDNKVRGVRIPDHQIVDLENGMKVLFIRDLTLPRVSFMALVGSGAVDDTKNKFGLSFLTTSLLDEGAGKYSSLELAEKLESLGADLAISPGYDFSTVSLRGLAYTKDVLLDDFIEILTQPRFPEEEISRLKNRIIGSLAKIEDDPEEYSNQLISGIIFGQHPYARPQMGTQEGVRGVSRTDILDFYRSNFTGANIQLAVVGNFDEAFEKRVILKFSTAVPSVAKASLKELKGQDTSKTQKAFGLFLKSKTGLVQTQIRMAQPFFARSHPDYLALRAANMALGGAFASRLNQHVRDDLGLTYGIDSDLDVRKRGGQFIVSTFTRNDKVTETIMASRKIIDDFVERGMTAEELETSKSVLIGQFPRGIETMDALAYQILALDFYGIDKNYLKDFIKNVNSLSLNVVNAKIKEHLHPDALQILVYGDGKKIGDSLKKIGKVQQP